MRDRDAAWARALDRVTALFARLGLPAQAVGGLAARAWGGTRDLVDLDFYVPERSLEDVAAAAPANVRRAPGRAVGPHWDVEVLVLDVAGCRVELGGAETARLRGSGEAPWQDARVDLAASVVRPVLGVPVPVMPLADLAAYKAVLGRAVDLVDLHELTGAGGNVAARLAVYGTLAPGEANHREVAGLRGTWMPGFVTGDLAPAGWGMTHGYPALCWHPDGPQVPVQMLVSDGLPRAWDRLDRFEGDAYRRIVVPVTTGEGVLLANIYVAADA